MRVAMSEPGRAPRKAARATLAGVALLALGIAWAAPAAAHYLELERDLKTPGVLTVGIALTGAPFAYLRDGELRGFELAVARAAAAAHGLALEAIRLPRGDLAPALAAGQVDAVNTLALERPPPSTRTIPYLVVGDHMMVLRGNPYRVNTPADLCGRIVAATAGTSAEAFAHEIDDRLRSQGCEPLDIHALPDQRFTHVPVSMGHAAAYFVGSVSAVGISHDPEARTRLVEGVFRPRREVGFTVRADDQELIHALEHALAGMVATGKYERLRAEHRLPPDLSPYR